MKYPSLAVCLAIGPNEKFCRISTTVKSILYQVSVNFHVFIAINSNFKLSIDLYELLDHPKISFYITDDTGVFDAQNQLLDYICLDFILFLGAGDYLIDRFALIRLAPFLLSTYLDSKSHVLYSPVLISKPTIGIVSFFDNRFYHFLNSLKSIPFLPIFFLDPTHNPCHTQGIFYKSNWLKNHSYEADINLMSDFIHTRKHMLWAFSHWIPSPICVFQADGISCQRVSLSQYKINLFILVEKSYPKFLISYAKFFVRIKLFLVYLFS